MILKHVISYWLMPLPFCLALIAFGLWFGRNSRRTRLGRFCAGAALVLLLLFCNRTVSVWLIRPLETRYLPVPELATGQDLPAGLAGCRYVAVLGGGHGDTPGLPALTKLSTSALGRIAEAARLLRVLPRADLIVSGPAEFPEPSHASILAQAAESLGVAPGRIHLIETAHDTEEEAAAIKSLVGQARVALVTSAWHMPRAMVCARRARLDAIPCPADYLARPEPSLRWYDLGWDAESLARSTSAVHERLGLLWMRLKPKRW